MNGDRDPWYASWFGEEYLALYPERDDRVAEQQAAFVRELLAPYASRGRTGFLDLACGTGRHAIALAERAATVSGLDLSLPLLLEARGREDQPSPGYARAEMRAIPMRTGTFGAVVNFFTSFGYFEDPTDDGRVVREVARILVAGGAFLAGGFNSERVIATLASREEKTIENSRVLIRRRYDPVTRRVEKEISIGEGKGQRTFKERVRAYTGDELHRLLESAGFSVRSVYGDFDGSPFDESRSPRRILLAVKDAAR